MRADLRNSHVNIFLLNRIILDSHAMGLDLTSKVPFYPCRTVFSQFRRRTSPVYRVLKFPVAACLSRMARISLLEQTSKTPMGLARLKGALGIRWRTCRYNAVWPNASGRIWSKSAAIQFDGGTVGSERHTVAVRLGPHSVCAVGRAVRRGKRSSAGARLPAGKVSDDELFLVASHTHYAPNIDERLQLLAASMAITLYL